MIFHWESLEYNERNFEFKSVKEEALLNPMHCTDIVNIRRNGRAIKIEIENDFGLKREQVQILGLILKKEFLEDVYNDYL